MTVLKSIALSAIFTLVGWEPVAAIAATDGFSSTTTARSYGQTDDYPPGCRNRRSFDACALGGKGCSLGTRRDCAQICRGLCDD